MKAPHRRVQVYLPHGVVTRLAEDAAKRRTTVSAVVRRMLREQPSYEGGADAPERVDRAPDGARVCRVGVRVSPAVLARLAAIACDFGQTPGGWCSSVLSTVAVGVPHLKRAEFHALVEANEQMRRLGSNLNQVARAVNLGVMTRGVSDPASDRSLGELVERCLCSIECVSARLNHLIDASTRAYRCADPRRPANEDADRG
jgi:hypothetical protein